MLEHAIEPDGPEEPATPPKTAAEFYVPKHTAEALNGNAQAPKIKRFSRKMLAGVAVVAGLAIVLAFTVGLQQPPPKPPEPVATTSKPPVPNADVNALPAGYDQMTPQLGEPRPGDHPEPPAVLPNEIADQFELLGREKPLVNIA